MTTLADLGRVLDLDTSTVSLALRDSPRVAEGTRQRVREAAIRFGYRPNLAARQLVGGPRRAQLLGLLLPESLPSLGAIVVARTARRLAELAEADGLVLHVSSTRSRAVGEATPESGLRPDGVFIWGDVPADVAAELARSRPAVVLDPSHPSYAGYRGHALALDNPGVGALMARHLAARGARRLLIVRDHGAHLQHLDRWEGARAAWVAERPVDSAAMAYAEELDDARLAAFARERDGAILCSSDFAALGLWRRLVRLGLRVPEDVRLTGVDGEDFAGILGLTTARFASEALADAAYATLGALIAGTPPPVIAPIPFALVPGATA